MRSALNCKHVKSVTAWGLLFQGEQVGFVVADYSDAGVVTLTINVWNSEAPLYVGEARHGQAGGGGYDKFSGAFDDAIRAKKQGNKMPMDAEAPDMHGTGKESVRSYLEGKGFKVIEVI